jgi:broad specificity phosphatase PhoE
MRGDKWLELEWLEDARNLIDWAKDVESENQVILFVRHSHRLHSDDQNKLLHMKLTPLGHEMAKQFGQHLPNRGVLEVFHSEHPRCVETAQGIVEGYKSNNQIALIGGAIRELLGPLVHTSIGDELIDFGIDGFINKWAKGKFPLSQIERLEDYGTRLWEKTVLQVNVAKKAKLLVHVSHDLVLMSMRRAVLGVEAMKENWIPFLGGFGLTKIDDSFQWFEAGRLTKVLSPC